MADFQVTVPPLPINMSFKKKELLSSAMKRTSEWILSQEIPSDVTINAGGVSFSLHKFPLISKCGYIRELVSETPDADISTIQIPDIPGGAEAFELAAKFCYGINFEISTENIAALRCAAEYLQMTEEYSVGNLVGRTEAYLTEVSLKSLAGAIRVLSLSESLLPMAEKTKLVSHCIDAIAFMACKESQIVSKTDVLISAVSNPKAIVDWWAEDLTVLRIDIFQRVLIAIMARGFKSHALAPILILYAQKSLRGLEVMGKGGKKMEPQQEHEKRVVLETIVSLLPREKNTMSVSFLSMLLRAAIYLETTVACRLDLEKRMALQLGQAVLDDLLIPAYSFTGDTLFDVDTIHRIMVNYIDSEMESRRFDNFNVDENYVPFPTSDSERVGKLMENYLAEIASDPNLLVSKFISLAELIPEKTRETEDGMYRAIDIYLKAHRLLSEMERKKVCSLMDCQKLSREACAHAAQNDRLPVQTVVQVLYYEQQRLRDVMSSGTISGSKSPALPTKVTAYTTDVHPVPDELSSLKTENENLKIELAKMKMRMRENDKPQGKSNMSSPAARIMPSANKPPLPRKSLISTVSKKLARLNVFARTDGDISKGRVKQSKDRRHSIS